MNDLERRLRPDAPAAMDRDLVHAVLQRGAAELTASSELAIRRREEFLRQFPERTGNATAAVDHAMEEQLPTDEERRETAAIDPVWESSPELARSRMNESLARLEMNTIEAKLVLDEIDQRISRLEPCTQPARDVAPELPKHRQVQTPVITQSVERKVQAAEQPPTPAATGGERRRRGDHANDDRQRLRYVRPAMVRETDQSWAWGPWREMLRRPGKRVWIGVCALGVAVAVVLLAWNSGRPSPVEHAKVGREPATSAVVSRAQKPSADVARLGNQPRPNGGGPEGSRPPNGGPASRSGSAIPPESLHEPSAAGVVEGSPGSPGIGVTDEMAQASTTSGASVDRTAAAIPNASGSRPAIDEGSRFAAAGRAGTPPTSRVHVSSGVMAGNLVTSHQPAYPGGLVSLFHTEGRVVMQVIVGKNGRVENVHVISGHHMLRGAARSAVSTWRYRPYSVNGHPVEVATIVSVEFHR